MSKPDISKLTVPELRELVADAEHRTAELRSASIVEARTRIEEILASYGLALIEVFPPGPPPGTKRANPTKGKNIPPKYRNPADPDQTWTGRGKQPAWFVAAKDAGHAEQDLLIK